MAQGIASYVRFYSGGTTYANWQNFYVGETSHGATFQDFNAGSGVVTRTADEAASSMSLPALPNLVQFTEAAIQGQYLVELNLYTVDPASANGSRVLVSAFLGEVVGASVDPVAITLELGLALDALTAQIPGRRMTTALIGNVPKL
jgi:hypothetical protein